MHVRMRRPRWALTVAATLVVFAGVARAELQPSEVFVVYNRNSQASRELAEYYMQKRGIPPTHSIGLDLPDGDEILRDEYLRRLRIPLRGWLRREDLQDRIRCLVTVYGVPLRLVVTGTRPADKPAFQEVAAELDAAGLEFQSLVSDLEGFNGGGVSSAPVTSLAGAPATKADVPKLLVRYQSARDAATARLQKAVAGQQAALVEKFRPLIQRGEGSQAILAAMQSTDPAGQQLIASLRAQGQKQREQLSEMVADCPRGPRRAEAHKMLRENYGLRSLVEHLQEDKANLEGKETHAALDSELALLWWDDYPLYRWVVNPLNWRLRHSPAFAGRALSGPLAQPVVMVARLDGPNTRTVKRMIDDSVAVEAQAPAGKFYIDARGIPAAGSGYGEYDEDLRQLASLLKDKTSWPVVPDNKPDLFGPDACPDAALYCGWYSLGKYVDSFTWARGSVAYHIASSEAVSLHNPHATFWCKRMLEEGVAATLGPVAEPYLHSFPRPRDFFGLLLTGRYTLAEVYWNTTPLASWMQTLLGDPLYNPFRKHPLLKPEDVFPAEWLAVPTSRPMAATAPSATQPAAAKTAGVRG